MTKTTLTLAALLIAAVAPAPAAPDGAADDLAIVRKAVARPAAQAEVAPAPSRRAAEPVWFRVRIVEKGEKGARVKVNLPLSFVRALGDDLPLPACEGLGKRHGLTLGELLRALDSGESLVEIEDDDASVRVWVE